MASPGRPDRDEDEVWAEIVASFDEPAADGNSPWPEQENVAESDDEDEEEPPSAAARVIKPADDGEDDEDSDEDGEEGHYVPPPPPPLPRTDLITTAAWVSLFGGPLYLLVMFMIPWHGPRWVDFTAVAAFVGGMVTLVLRMSDEPRGPDDGAVV